MTRAVDPFLKVSSPRIILVRIIVFLLLCAALAAVLYKQIAAAFMNNPGLNGVIFGVLAIGIILAIRQVSRLFPGGGMGEFLPPRRSRPCRLPRPDPPRPHGRAAGRPHGPHGDLPIDHALDPRFDRHAPR